MRRIIGALGTALLIASAGCGGGASQPKTIQTADVSNALTAAFGTNFILTKAAGKDPVASFSLADACDELIGEGVFIVPAVYVCNQRRLDQWKGKVGCVMGTVKSVSKDNKKWDCDPGERIGGSWWITDSGGSFHATRRYGYNVFLYDYPDVKGIVSPEYLKLDKVLRQFKPNPNLEVPKS